MSMKKLEAILRGCKLVDRLFGLREKEIRRKIEAAKDECEEKKVKAQMDYETAMNLLGEKDVNYRNVLNSMIQAKQSIIEAQDTLAVIKEIEADLDSEADMEKEDKE